MPNEDSEVKDIDYDDPKYRITPFQQAAASCTGALLTSLLVTPLDVVKIRLQSQQKQLVHNKCYLYCNGLMDHICSCSPEDPHSKWVRRPGQFNGTIDAFIKISKTEGITSLWSGLSPTLVLAVPATIVYFVVYEQLRLRLKDKYNKENIVGIEKCQPFWIPMLSGATARVVSVTIVSPLELIRTKMQSQNLSYKELSSALKSLVKQDGVRGLWRGILPTFYRDVPFSAIYWMHYETIKSFYCDSSNVPSFGISFIAGAVSGSIAAAITTPFDVIKTHQQTEFGEETIYGAKPKKRRSTADIFKQIYAQYGVRGLFTGLVPRLVKVAPACAIMISSFEYGKIFFNRLANQQFTKVTEPDVDNMSQRLSGNKSVPSLKDTNVLSKHTGDIL